MGVRSIFRVVHEILNPQVDRQRPDPVRHLLGGPAEDPSHAQARVHGIALAAGRFDVEYLGLPLPTAPAGIAADR